VPKEDDLGSAATVAGTPVPAAASTQPSLPGSAAATPAPPESIIADRYEILGLLGMGGMGRVYRAHDRTLDEVVALKLLRRELVDVPGMLERFRQEVKLARRVTSPHVVRTFDLGQHGSEHFLTMELVDGRSLAQLLEDGPLPLDEILRIARAMAAGIATAHATGVLHRDLKPDNVLVGKDGRIAITDFGIARVSAAPRDTVDRFVGTPAYMAPEQVEGKDDIGTAADVYAFGGILFEMVAGRRPFVGTDVFAVALARLREEPPDPRTFRAVPDSLAALVLRCLARVPGKRPADGRALVAALAGIDEHSSSTPVAAGPATRVPAKTSRSVALLPLRASGELAEIADGLSEEIVDALSMTRALRVRPLSSLRSAARPDVDSREIGKSLGVDVIVDGSIRKRGDAVRVAARVIGVDDGFQLWANHFDTSPQDLLSTGDKLVRAIASALTVDLEMPERAKVDPKIAELYLESKAKLRAGWLVGGVDDVMAPLEAALQTAPDDAGVLALLALTHARSSFYGGAGDLARATELAERAVDHAPTSGEGWLALGVASLYRGDMGRCTRALIEAVTHAPGLALAQALLGAVVLEAGHIDAAIMHLEGAHSLDPMGSQIADLPRAYLYAGRQADADRMLRETPSQYSEISIARFKMWRGELHEMSFTVPQTTSGDFAKYTDVVIRLHRTGRLEPGDREAMKAVVDVPNPRLRATRSQFMAEFFLFVGDLDAGMESIEQSVASGLQDHLWLMRCPLLDKVRDRPRFGELEAIVRKRAREVLAVIEHVE